MAFRCKDLMMDVVPSSDPIRGYALCGVTSCAKSAPAPLAPELPDSDCPLASCGSKSIPPSPEPGEEQPGDTVSALAFLQEQLRQALHSATI